VGRKVATVVVVVAALAAAAYLVKGWLESDETKVLRAVDGLAEAIDSKSILSFIDGVDPEFRDCKNMDYSTLKGVVYQTFKRFEVLELQITEVRVLVDDDRKGAVAWFNCSLRAGLNEGGETIDLAQKVLRGPLIVLKFVNRDGRWKVMGADYGPDAKPPPEVDTTD